ncbi:tyrosine-type recombinase/integrase [Niveibacterium microcysteis]|uniref:Tyrosine-type recombinase/integrase n=1 Tax=Niveibacterium microcysteis TaxID=2811415 RepID=A0ABX7MAB7_9RHOO|nr:integrase arm-type DNA-binding domain-containing protein [Niveibacterium microcysteis]QSI78690.1 tyrosine-type recombinase/integrase [Niveibacterium microcysteis]
MALTHNAASKTPPRADGKPLKLADGAGLYLLIKGNGSRYWRMKYRWGGKEKLLALGVFPEVSLKDARDRRDAARRLLSEGTDPGEQRRVDKAAARRATDLSFESIALEWHSTKAAEWVPGHASSVLATLKTYLFPDLGRRPIAEIEPLELLEVLRKVERAGKIDTAKRLRERCDAIFRLAVISGRAKHNPAADLAEAMQVSIVKPRPALTAQQLPAFLRALAQTDTITLQTRVLFTLLLTCFTRIGETVRAEWEHIDFDRALWVIPPENRKLKNKLKLTAPPHIIPLPIQALAALRELEQHRRPGPYVFPSVRGVRAHMSESTPLKALERMGYGGKNTENGNVVTHGFRATASTILNEAGFNPDAVERQLSHTEANQVRAAYNRAQYMEERRSMLQWWANYLEEVERSTEGTQNAGLTTMQNYYSYEPDA